MANNSPIPIARKASNGSFFRFAIIRFTNLNTKLAIEDIEEGAHEFNIPETGLLSFEVSTAPEQEGEGTDYFITKTESAPGVEISAHELKEEHVSLSINLEGVSGEVSLKMIGQDDLDILRGTPGVNLIDGAGLAFQRTTDSIILRVYRPQNE